AQADRAYERVGRRAEPLGFAAAEHLRLGPQLDVRLDPDDDLVRATGLRSLDRRASHGEGGAEVRSGATMRRLRFTITRSSLTDTRYLSRLRHPASRESPRASKTNSRPALASHEATYPSAAPDKPIWTGHSGSPALGDQRA